MRDHDGHETLPQNLSTLLINAVQEVVASRAVGRGMATTYEDIDEFLDEEALDQIQLPGQADADVRPFTPLSCLLVDPTSLFTPGGR